MRRNKAWWSKGVVRNATVQLSWIGQRKSWSAWIEKLGRYWQWMVVYTAEVMLPKCIDKGKKGKGDVWYWVVCQEGEQNLYGYLRKSTEWVRMVLKEKVFVEEKSSGLPSVQNSDVSWEESWLEMAQECFVKDGNRRLYPRCIRASFKNNSVKHSINKTPETSLGRLCGDSTETVRHIVSGCSKLAQREYI